MGLRGAVSATDGTVVKPSVWGKLKANVQFLAIFMAIIRTSSPWGPLYPDQYAMIAAALVTVGSAVSTSLGSAACSSVAATSNGA